MTYENLYFGRVWNTDKGIFTEVVAENEVDPNAGDPKSKLYVIEAWSLRDAHVKLMRYIHDGRC